MNWLARLKKTETDPNNDPASPTPDDAENLTKPVIATAITAANDTTPDPDRWCWPHSTAMNTSEINTFTARLHQFTGRGLAEATAEVLADKLVKRDRDGDDRRLCLECLHLKSGFNLWSCTQWRQAGLGAAGLSADLVQQLQRCDGFTAPRTNQHIKEPTS